MSFGNPSGLLIAKDEKHRENEMQMNKSRWYMVGLACLAVVALVGCKSNSQAAQTAVAKSAGTAYISKTLTTSYTGALDAASQLMLGMLRLEGTDNAITTDQAKAMLTALQSLQGQALKADAERNAVLTNIEAQLTPTQASAIANMRLTQNDLQAWTQTNSQGPGAGPMQGGAGPQGTPGAGPGQGGPRPQGTPGAGPQGMPGGTGPRGAPGAQPASGGAAGSAGMGQNNVLLNALVRLLMQKSGNAPSPDGRVPAGTPAPGAVSPATPTKP
jgi:hypothetical protein